MLCSLLCAIHITVILERKAESVKLVIKVLSIVNESKGDIPQDRLQHIN